VIFPWKAMLIGSLLLTVAINLLLDLPIGDRESVRQWAAGRPADPVTD